MFDEDGFDCFQHKMVLILNVLRHYESSSNIVNCGRLLSVQCLRWSVTKTTMRIFFLVQAAKRRPKAYTKSPRKLRPPYFLAAPQVLKIGSQSKYTSKCEPKKDQRMWKGCYPMGWNVYNPSSSSTMTYDHKYYRV
jgi:hypothetical protein